MAGSPGGGRARPGKGGADGSPTVKRDAPKEHHVKGDGIKVEKTLKKRRVDDFQSGFVDLVTDRVKNRWFSIFVIILFPVVLLNILIVRQISSVPDHWLDQIPAQMAILQSPTDLVLGVKSRASGKSLTVIVANANSLPVVSSQVTVSLVSMVPEEEFDFCNGIIPGSNLDERLGPVCGAKLAGHEKDTDVSGIAVFDEFAFVAGVPGTYLMNVTVSKVQDYQDEFGREATGALIGAHVWFQVKVHRNLNITISPTTRPPKAIEYRTVFTGKGTVCSAPADGGLATCAQGDREDLRPPAASIDYLGGSELSNLTTVTFFTVANFSEVLLTNVQFPRTNYPHMAGSVDRMARIASSLGGYRLQDTISAPDGSTGVSDPDGSGRWHGSVEFPGFQVLGSNNPALFFAFYCSGVFSIWNKNWDYDFPGNEFDGRPPESIRQVLEMTMLPRRDYNPLENAQLLRPGEGEWWIGGQAPAEIGDDGVAAGDQGYLPQIEVIDSPPDVLEGAEFVVQLITYACAYPRARCDQRYFFVPGVTIFAEAVPVSGIVATNREDFKKRSKVLLNAISEPSTEENSFFSQLAFSEFGDEGVYRIRIFADGHWHFDSPPITVRTKINLVLVRLPASVQTEWPGCDSFMTLPPTDLNSDGFPDSDFPASQEMAICIEAQPFVPITNLPYAEAYVCSMAQGKLAIASLKESCNPIRGKTIRVTVNSAEYDPFSNDDVGVRIWDWPKNAQDITKDRDITELPAVKYEQKFPVVDPKHELSSLTINHMFKKSMFVSFSVGGISSPIKFAIAMNDTSALQGALADCMDDFSPVAYLEILDENNFAADADPPIVTVHPGITWRRKVFAVDMYGKPAQKRPICMHFFELDWRDYFADEVKLQDDYALLRREQSGATGNPWTTLENFTYYNSTCWLTNNKGIANVVHFWDAQEVKFRQGAFAYYFESAEWEDGAIYKRFGQRWFTSADDSWQGKRRERACLASYGFHVPVVRTHSHYIYIRQNWAKPPAAVFGTARWPQPKPEDGTSFWPEHGSHYSSTDRRTVTVGTYHRMYVRLYRGAAGSDFAEGTNGVYSKGVTLTSYIISAPPNFPRSKQKCYPSTDSSDPQDLPKDSPYCWHPENFALTNQAQSDDYGYGTFDIFASEQYVGVFTILIAVGDSQSGIYSGTGPHSNEFSQTFEIEFLPFKGLPSCDGADAMGAGLTPSIKYFHQCPTRNPDGSCSWETALCPIEKVLLTLQDDFLGDPTPECIPLGTIFPRSISAIVQNDAGEKIQGLALSLSGGPGSESLSIHPDVSLPSDAAGRAVVDKVVLDYAEPGMHTLVFRLKFDNAAFAASTAVSKTFRVTDELIAEFIQQPPGSVVMRHVIGPAVAVKVRLKRKCFVDVVAGAGHHSWQPPVLVLHAALATRSGGNFSNRSLPESWDAAASILLTGAQSRPTFSLEHAYSQDAVALFTDLKILSGMQGTYRLHVAVKGSDTVLATSLPIRLARYARTLHLIDPMPRYPNADTTLMLRVKAVSSSGLPVTGSFVSVSIEARRSGEGQSAGKHIRDDRNVTALLDFVLANAVTGSDGLATFSIVFRQYVYPGVYVLRFQHAESPDVYSSCFEIIPPIKELEMLTNPAADDSYPEVLAPDVVTLETRIIKKKPADKFRKIVVTQSPAGMKGTIVGEHIDDVGPVIRALDHRGFGVIGLNFGVSLVDYQDNIVHDVVSAKRGSLLTTDWGLNKEGICGANDTRFDCDGTYVFEALATNNRLVSGFYRFRFECEGISIVQGTDLLFMNEYMPNILRLSFYMYLSMGTCGCCLLLFQMNRLDKLVFDRYTGKYVQSPEARFLLGVLGTTGLGIFGWFSYLFYVTIGQSKTPPHVLNGVLVPTDIMSTFSSYILYVLVLVSCLHAFFVMSQKKEKFKSDVPEKFLQKLGMNAKVADARRLFVGKLRKHIPKPPKISAARGRLAKKLEKYKAKLRELGKFYKMVYDLAAFLYSNSRKLYVRMKYANPAFQSLYFAWPDVFYGIRFRSSLLLNVLLVVTSCLVGLWFGEKFSSLLTKYYAEYISMVLKKGHEAERTDWFDEIWTNKGGLGTIQQVTVIFHARTSKLGQPFFWDLLSAFRFASFWSTILSTIIIFVRVAIMAVEQRNTICNLRVGKVKKEIGDVRGLSLIDGCAYMGSQAVLMLFGWFAFFVFCYTGIFFLAWDSTSRILTRLWFPMMLFSMFLYVCSFALARLRVINSPGLTVVGRGQFAMSEFTLVFLNIMIGPFMAFGRFMVAVTRTMMTWFLLHNKIHEVHELSGLGNGMYKSAMYIHHAHNNPVTRAVVERLHDQLRNMDTMRRFPPDNIEPETLKKQIAENKAAKIQRRTISRMLLLLLMQANDHQGLKALRKQHMALYQRRLRKGVFTLGGKATDGDEEVSEEHVAAALAGMGIVGGAATISNELVSLDDDEEEVASEGEHEKGLDDEDDDPDSSRKSTTRSFGLKLSFPSARKKKDNGGQEEHIPSPHPDE